MFNDKYELTQAVLEGRKTQKRLIVPKSTLRKAEMMLRVCGGSIEDKIEEQTPYCFGEEVAVAQAYKDCLRMVCLQGSRGWYNKLFVNADFMPHRIKITGIRIERLQDISEEDCLKEGFEFVDVNNNWGNMCSHNEYILTYKDYLGRYMQFTSRNHKEAFSFLIDKTCGIGTWEINPYVFVYDFELIK